MDGTMQSEMQRSEQRRPVDLVHLARFTLGNRELEQEVLHLFVTQAPSYIAELRTATSDKAWKIAAHTIKGSARAVGAWELAEAAATAELLAQDPDGPARDLSITAVEAAFARAASYIKTLATIAA